MSAENLTNLWQETVDCLKENGKTVADIRFIAGNGHEIAMDDFERIAKACDYDSGYGSAEVPEDLKIVGDDWWLSRGEYDGSEWWMFLCKPERPKAVRRLAGFNIREYGYEKYDYGDVPENP